jgi:hypothetical protein
VRILLDVISALKTRMRSGLQTSPRLGAVTASFTYRPYLTAMTVRLSDLQLMTICARNYALRRLKMRAA